MAKGKKLKPTSNRNPSQQRTGGGGSKNNGAIHKARKMNTFPRVSSSVCPPLSLPSLPTSSRSGIGGVPSKRNHNQNRTTTTGLNAQPAAPSSSSSSMQNQKQVQHSRPIIPFGRRDRILLAGEGRCFFFFFPPLLCCTTDWKSIDILLALFKNY
jgi:hypothetical protein